MTKLMDEAGMARFVAALKEIPRHPKENPMIANQTSTTETLEDDAFDIAEAEAKLREDQRKLSDALQRYEAAKAKSQPIHEVVAASNEVAVAQAVVAVADPAHPVAVDPVTTEPTPVVQTIAPVGAAAAAVDTEVVEPTPAPATIVATPTVAAVPSPPVAAPVVASAPKPAKVEHVHNPLKTGKKVASPDGRKKFNFATSSTEPLMVDQTAVFPTPLDASDEAAFLANPAGELAAMTAKYGTPTYATHED